MKRKNYTTFAAIHLGSEMLSMQITEYHNTEGIRLLSAATDAFAWVRQLLKIK